MEARAIREGCDVTRTELEVLRDSRPHAPAYSPGRDGSMPIGRTIEAAVLIHMGCEALADSGSP